ncbi:YhcG family protein [Maridesulfovibrio ferrireducens]|uniref:PDDEXK nuclease domain-containing protein n=1 Tax=Maridesulfovibrio ferrireducens TaxID=246191 RepID=UPI001A1BF71A|nr:PDDEXK nuclease domain-containing protein [Maridesulfovibrio ferrireducens]MBI9113354.1 DUF1016 family protein [Maridesulfovibrio ferrireducens]
MEIDRHLIKELRNIISQARSLVVRHVNSLQVVSNYLIGQRIVEFEQGGAERAEYGKSLLKCLSTELTAEFGRGYSHRNLDLMKKFYLIYKIAGISQTSSAKLLPVESADGVSSDVIMISQTLSAKFKLSWSHYVFLMTVGDQKGRSFYEIEAINGDWSLKELRRQCNSSLYERLALSRDKDGVQKLACEGQIVTKPEDNLKDPYVLEFLGLSEKSKYSENDLETAIIDKLEDFLLELGKGFLFEARQKRFTFDDDHYFVDLVFYNRLLRCYTLIDLKIGELTHQDLGQMQMYVNYFDRYVKLDDEKPTIGIIICNKNKKSLVEITLPKDANIHASEYQLYLPSKEELKKQMDEVQAEWEDRHGHDES